MGCSLFLSKGAVGFCMFSLVVWVFMLGMVVVLECGGWAVVFVYWLCDCFWVLSVIVTCFDLT